MRQITSSLSRHVGRLATWWNQERKAWRVASAEGAKPRTTRAAIASAVLAVVSLFVTPLLAIPLALGSGFLGLVGFVRSASPRLRGGLLALGGVALSCLAIVFALLRAIF